VAEKRLLDHHSKRTILAAAAPRCAIFMPATRPLVRFSPRSWVPAIVLIAITIVAYLPALRAGFIWDDDDYVTKNANLRSVDGLIDTWLAPRSLPQYYPLVHSSFWIEYQLWELHPLGYHAVNILLHAGGAILLWRLLVALEVPGALLGACLFAVHPINVESVAWVTERKNVLCGVFYFASALAYWKWDARRRGDAAEHWRAYVLALGLFLCALLSKTVACSLPATLLLLIWWKRGRVRWRDVIPLVPMFILGLLFASITAYLERKHVLAVGREWDYSPLARVLIAGKAVWFYAITLVLPFDLSFVYPKWFVNPRDLIDYAWPFAVALVVVALFMVRRRIGRGPLVATLVFVGTLIPALGFFNIYPMRYTFVADHYAYHASAAFLTLVAAGLARASARAGAANRWVAGAVLVALLAGLTFARARVYHDPLTLWQDTLTKNPQSWMVHLNLAKALADAGDDARAQMQFEEALALGPDVPETHWNMGINLFRRDQYDAALSEYAKALELDPTLAQAHYGRGNVFVAEKRPEQAMAEYAAAIAIKPDYAQAHNALGELLVHRKDYAQAMPHFLAAIALDPSLAAPHFNLAALFAATGRSADARNEFDRAVQLDPSLERYRRQVLR
jgi:tetratricopeptide (TPR) repeat protein